MSERIYLASREETVNGSVGKPSGDTTGVRDGETLNEALDNLPAILKREPAESSHKSGRIWLPEGAFYIEASVLENLGPQVSLEAAVRWATTIYVVGEGTGVRQFNPIYGGGGLWGGGIKGITLDGTFAGNNTTAFHLGDGEQYDLDLAIQNFAGTNSIGLHLDNTLWWTEKCHGNIFIRNCTTHVAFDASSGPAYASTTLVSASGGTAVFRRAGGWLIPGTTEALQEPMLLLGSAGLTTPLTASVSTLKVKEVKGEELVCTYTGTAPSGTEGTLTVVSSTTSFGYHDLNFYIYMQPGQDGVVVKNGAFPYHGKLAIRGNSKSSSEAATNAILRPTGQMPEGHESAGSYAAIYRDRLDIQVEVGAGTHGPYSIYFGTPGSNTIQGCYGILDFAGGPGTATKSNVKVSESSGSLYFQGPISGDTNLNPAGNTGLPHLSGALLLSESYFNGANGAIYLESGDFFQATLSASITMALGDGNVEAPQRKTIVIVQAASGGPYTVAWPKEASPTLSKPTVKWPGGTAPTMSTGAGAIDVYNLVTRDGKTWYGQAIQALA